MAPKGCEGRLTDSLGGYDAFVGQRVITAAEFEQLSYEEQDALFNASVATDLSDVPPSVLARARALVAEQAAPTDPQSTA